MPNIIAVDENKIYQVMDGFGSSITEASSYLYQNVLSAPNKQSFMNALFDKETGIGLSMLRNQLVQPTIVLLPIIFHPLNRRTIYRILIFHMSSKLFSQL